MKFFIAAAIAAVLVATVAASSIDEEHYELLKLVALNRHGHRAPNKPYWKMCPNDKANLKKYDVEAEDLTGIGFAEEYKFGEYLRHTYGHFIGKTYDRLDHYCRAVGEPRTLQSAQAIMQGLFPNGFGPKGFLPSNPQVVPVYSDMNEDMLKDKPCFPRANKDNAEWFNTKGLEMMKEPKNVEIMNKLEKLCGTSQGIIKQYGYDWFIKLVVDGVIFNHDYGLKVVEGKVDDHMVWQLRNISIRVLLGKFYHSDAQQTYTTVDFPEKLVTSLEAAAKGKKHTRLDTYAVHREELYGFASFYGFLFHVPGYPIGELPAGSSLIFELLKKKANNEVFVRLILWTPHAGHYTVAVPHCKNHHLCSLEEFKAVYDERIKRTGTWQQLCDYKEDDQ